MKLTERYFTSLLRLFQVDTYSRLDAIDFHKPWWHTLLHHKWSLLFIVLGTIAWHCFFTLAPILIVHAFDPTASFTFFYVILLWLLSETFKHITFLLYACTSMIIPLSIQHTAYATLLEKKHPLINTPGAIVAKIERCTQSYKELFDLMVFELVPIFTGLVTMITSFFVLHTRLGILSFLCLLCIFSISTFLFLLNRYAFEPHILHKDDQAKAAGLDGLLKTTDKFHKVSQLHRESLTLSITFWFGFYGINYLTRILWVASVCIIGTFLYSLVQDATLETIQATTFLISYIHSTNKIRQVGRRIEHFAQCIIRIKDLFAFMQLVDTQSYLPAVEEKNLKGDQALGTSQEKLSHK